MSYITGISGNVISAASAGYAPTNSADVSAIASAYSESAASGKLDSSASSSFYGVDNPSGFITGVDLSNYATTAYVDSSVSGKLDSSASSSFYTTANESGYIGSAYVESSISAYQPLSGMSAYESSFSAGDGLEFVQSGDDRVLQVEAPVDIVAGPGIVIDNPDGNTLRVSTDENYETVLYDGSTTGSDGDITLSESMANFERIGIFFSIGSAYEQGTYWYGGKWQFFETGDLSITKKFCISDNMNNGDSANTLNFKNQSYTVSNDNLTFTLARSTQLYYNGSSWAVSTTAKSKIYKVVGIHRIAGGN